MTERYDLEERLLEYAARIIRLVEKLPDNRAGNHVGGQLLRSAIRRCPITARRKPLNPSRTSFTS